MIFDLAVNGRTSEVDLLAEIEGGPSEVVGHFASIDALRKEMFEAQEFASMILLLCDGYSQELPGVTGIPQVFRNIFKDVEL